MGSKKIELREAETRLGLPGTGGQDGGENLVKEYKISVRQEE